MSLFNSEQANRLYQQGLEKYKRHHSQRATADFEQALKLYGQLNDRSGVAKASYMLGMAQLKQGNGRERSEFMKAIEDYTSATKCFETALQTYRETGNRQMAAGSLHQLGLVCAARRKYEQAIDYYRQALKIFRELNDTAEVTAVEADLRRASSYVKKDEPKPEPTQSSKYPSKPADMNRGTSTNLVSKSSSFSKPSSSSYSRLNSYPKNNEDALQQ
jgi:tetratricopeptide (TPR) repeat protein